MTAICNGVANTEPWPMPAINVSPCCQAVPVVASFHSRLGISPAALARNVDAERGAKAETPGHRREAVDAEPPRRLVEEDVAGLLDRVVQTQGAVPAMLPAVERGVAKLDVAGAGDRGIRGDTPAAKAASATTGLNVDPGG